LYDTLIFLHVLAGFFLGAGVVTYSAFVLGSPVNRTTRLVAEIGVRVATGLVSFALLAYLVAVWAMTTKPT